MHRSQCTLIRLQLLGFHFDGDEAVEFEVILSAYETDSQHHVLELNKCVGSSSASSGGLVLGRLLQLLVTELKAKGFRVQRYTEQSSSGSGKLLSVPSEGTSVRLAAYSASTGLHLAPTPGELSGPTPEQSGSDMLAALSQPGMDASMLQDWSARASRLPRWRSTEDVLAPSPASQGTFQQRRTEAALTPVLDGDDSDGVPPRGYMFRAMRGMRSQDSIVVGGSNSTELTPSDDGIKRSVSASAAAESSSTLLPSMAADSPSTWAPIRSMLVHGPAGQREEAVRVLASLSANPVTHDSIVKAKLPTLLARMLGLNSRPEAAAPLAPAPEGTPAEPSHGSESAGESSPLCAIPERLSRVGRALVLAMVENLSKSAVGLECMKQNGMLLAVRRLWSVADEQTGSFTLQPGAEVLFSDLQGPASAAPSNSWVELSLSPPHPTKATPPYTSGLSRATQGVEPGTEPPCPDVGSATRASRLSSVLSHTRSTLGSLAQEAVSNASVLKRRMSLARDALYSAFAASKLQGVAEQQGQLQPQTAPKATALPHVPAQDEAVAPSPSPLGAVRWTAVEGKRLPAAPVRPPLRHEVSAGSVGSDGGVSARMAAIEAELATLPSAPAEPVVAQGGTPSPKARRGSACSDRSGFILA